jgi:hypothetical protein
MQLDESRFNSTPRSTSLSPIRESLDRFIPGRRSPTESRDSLHLTKRLFDLPDGDKVIQRQYAARDPFSPPIRNVTLVEEQYRQLQTPRRSSSASNILSPSTLGTGFSRNAPNTRSVSQGAVWSVGGSAAASESAQGISTGRGVRMASGTNAPLYSTIFLTGPDPEADVEAHERRLALALDVDQKSRILSPTQSSASSSSSRLPKNSPSESSGRRPYHGHPIWKDAQWNKNDASPSLFLILSIASKSLLTSWWREKT